MTNAHTARNWLLREAGDEAHVARHFVALSSNLEAVQSFGIDPANMFPLLGLGGRSLFLVVRHRSFDRHGRRV